MKMAMALARMLPMVALAAVIVLPGGTVRAAGGLLVDGVSAGGAAEAAGLQAGDLIIKLGDRTIRALPDLESVLGARKGGDELAVVVLRDGKQVPLKMTLGGEPGAPPRMGVMLAITPETAADTGKPLPRSEADSILAGIASALREGYIYEDKGIVLADQVEGARRDERFAHRQTLGDFVTAVNRFLQEIGNDKHLGLRFGAEGRPEGRRVVRRGPAGGAPGPEGGSGGRKIVRQGPGSPGHGPGSPGADPGHGPGDRGRPGPDHHSPSPGMADFGVRDARVLEGNVGYLDLGMFAGSDAAKPVIDRAMMTLKDTDALIIDLGRNGGGAPWMVRYLSGFFFDQPTHLASTWMRGMDAPQERWTLGGQPTDAFHHKPVYILVSGRTFSAAESFTFGLVTHGRVTLVGERTGGGGHFGEDVTVSPDLRLFLPRGRTYNPKTGKGWEAEGIAPDIEIPYSEARDRAVAAFGESRKTASRRTR